MSQALASGDISEILSTGGGIAGGVATTFGILRLIEVLGLTIESGGAYLLLLITTGFLGNIAGSVLGNTTGKAIEGVINNEQICWV